MKAILRATADGGTNVWYHFAQMAENDLNNPIPDMISGDFDSADPKYLNHFKLHGAKIIHTLDQDETDFNKCIREVVKELALRETKVNIIIFRKIHEIIMSFVNKLNHYLG